MKYDLVVVVDPQADAKETQDKLTTLLEKEGFTVSDMSYWGKKTLAYPIKKHTEAHYFSCVISANSANPANLSQRFKLDEKILRFLILIIKEEKKTKPAG